MSDNDGIVIALYDPEKTYTNQKRFDCENKTINKFVAGSLKKQVRQSLSQCFVLLDSNNDDRFIGFYTISSFAINADELEVLSKGGLPSRIPCTRLIMLGVDKEYKKRGLGKLLMQSVILKSIQAAEKIGIYGLYLDAEEDAFTFYSDLGFTALQAKTDSRPTPMFIHIDTMRLSLSNVLGGRVESGTETESNARSSYRRQSRAVAEGMDSPNNLTVRLLNYRIRHADEKYQTNKGKRTW